MLLGEDVLSARSPVIVSPLFETLLDPELVSMYSLFAASLLFVGSATLMSLCESRLISAAAYFHHRV